MAARSFVNIQYCEAIWNFWRILIEALKILYQCTYSIVWPPQRCASKAKKFEKNKLDQVFTVIENIYSLHPPISLSLPYKEKKD
jgi:hypothetical protein